MRRALHYGPIDHVRRATLRDVLALCIGACTCTRLAHAQSADPRAAFMAQAFAMRDRAVAAGDQPYGAVIVKEGRIIAEGVSAVITSNDPTAHAEMQAIRAAARALGTQDLSGCDMYGSSRACPMCEAAAYRARVSRLYFGSPPVDAGPPRLR